MKIADDQPSGLSALDRPNSYIGRSVPRPNLGAAHQGRGQYVSDVVLPRMAHVAFCDRRTRMPASTRSTRRDARRSPGVIAVVTGAELAQVITPWVGVLTHLKGIKSAPQHAIAVDRACWQGEAVCAVVARTRAEAEDACALVAVDYEPLAAGHGCRDRARWRDAGDPSRRSATISPSSARSTPAIPTEGFAEADAIAETTFVFGRHTGVTNEPRAIVADWNPGEQRLTVYQGTQAPHMMQNLFAKHLGLEEHQVRVLTKDVGGSFGIKVHTYADEMATVALAKLLRRPVKFVADRLESFSTDIHARDHRVKAQDRRQTRRHHHRVRDRRPDRHRPVFGLSAHQRHRGEPGGEPGRRPLHLPELPRARPRRVPEQERDVPVPRRRPSDRDARSPKAWSSLRRRRSAWTRSNCGGAICSPTTPIRRRAPSGIKFEKLSHHASLDKILAMMDYAGLRAEQARLRARGIHRGIGFASFIEVTNPSAAFYGVGGARISSQDGATLRLDATGAVFCHSGVTEQGQGAEAVLAQCVATVVRRADRAGARRHRRHRQRALWRRHLGLARRRHRRRGGVAGRQGAARQRARAAGSILQADPKTLDIRAGIVVDADSGRERLRLDEVARIVYFRPDTLPPGFQAEFMATRHYVPRAWPFAFTNGVQASYLEVDIRDRRRSSCSSTGASRIAAP